MKYSRRSIFLFFLVLTSLGCAIYFLLPHAPNYFTIGITNQSTKSFIKEVRFKNRSTGVNERIAGTTGNIRGQFPAKMTVVVQAADGTISEKVFEVARYAPVDCHRLEIRVMEDDIPKLLFVRFNDKGGGMSFYDPLASVGERQDDDKETAMCVAAQAGDIETVKKLLDEGVSPNAQIFGAYVPAIEWAAKRNHPDVVSLLISRGARIGNAILPAAEKLDPEILKLMVSHGGDVNLVYQYNSPIYAAIEGDNADNVRWLVEHGADLNTIFEGLRNPAITQAIYRNAKLVPLFLELGADPLARTLDKNQTPLEVAIECREKTPSFKHERQKELDIAIDAIKKTIGETSEPEGKQETKTVP